MKILSLYSYSHDSALSFLVDGVVVFNLEKERFSRIKEDKHIDRSFLDFCRKFVDIEDFDILCCDAESLVDLKVRFSNADTDFIFNIDSAIFPGPDLSQRLARDIYISGLVRRNDGREVPLLHVHHHFAHIASAAFTSPFPPGPIISADAGGCQTNLTVGEFDSRGDYTAHKWEWAPELGYLWGIIPRFYGISQPGSLMAIGAYGAFDSSIYRKLRYALENFYGMSFDVWQVELASLLGLDLDGVGRNGLLDPSVRGNADLAHTLQILTDEVFSSWFRAFETTTSKNLIFTGGLALNCIGNSRAQLISQLSEIHVPPNPNDSGLAMGAALATHYYISGKKYEPEVFAPYLGPIYSDQAYEVAINHILSAFGVRASVYSASCSLIVKYLCEGHIIARFYGRSEAGPRALGHRSFIALPNLPNLRERMNEIKQREWYRPFAPIVLESMCDDLFENWRPFSFYMNTSAVVRESWRARLSGVIHADGTTRPQAITGDICPDTFRLVSEVFKSSGIPAILNTSFNVAEPLVETPLHAANTFVRLRGAVRCLQLGDHFVVLD